MKTKIKEIPRDVAEKLINANREKLMDYADVLSKANVRARLTGSIDYRDIFDEHIIDCAMALPLLPLKAKVIDVGTGGGLPGIVWAICRNDVSVVLLDSVKKKCAALEDIVRILSLENVQVCCARAEEFASLNQEKYDVATARAVAHLGVLLEYFSPFVKIGGKCIAFKGPRAFEELREFHGKEKILGWSGLEIWGYDVSGKRLFIFTWQKASDAEIKLPRRVGIPEKRPWWR